MSEKRLTKPEQIALLMLKATPEERKTLFRRIDELREAGIYVDKTTRNELQRYKENR